MRAWQAGHRVTSHWTSWIPGRRWWTARFPAPQRIPQPWHSCRSRTSTVSRRPAKARRECWCWR